MFTKNIKIYCTYFKICLLFYGVTHAFTLSLFMFNGALFYALITNLFNKKSPKQSDLLQTNITTAFLYCFMPKTELE